MKRNDLFLHSFTLSIGLMVWAVFNHTVGSNQLLSIISTIIYFIFYGAFAYFLIRKVGFTSNQFIPNMVFVGVLGILIFSIGYYVYASHIDPAYTLNQVANAQVKWEEMNYSSEAISGQVELTDTFQNPAKWSVQLFGVNLVVYLFISFLVFGFRNIFSTYKS